MMPFQRKAMRRLVAGLCASAAMLVTFRTPCRAEVVEVPLDGLVRVYSDGPVSNGVYVRWVTFTLERIPSQVHGASFRLGGYSQPGSYECRATESLAPSAGYSTMQMQAVMFCEPAISGMWLARGPMPDTAGTFEWTASFELYKTSANFDFLLDGVAEITLEGGSPTIIPECHAIVPAVVDVHEATLILDADFLIPAETATWSRIKALYK